MILGLLVDSVILGAFICVLDKRWGGAIIAAGLLGIMINYY